MNAPVAGIAAECRDGCRYAQDVGMPEHHCSGGCYYADTRFKPCPACEGEGEDRKGSRCRECNGEGLTEQEVEPVTQDDLDEVVS